MDVRRQLPSYERHLARALAVGGLLLVLAAASPAAAVQTFPDPFGGDGTHVDLRAGSTGQDIGDVFYLRVGATFQVEILLEPPNSFIESHICLSADPFTSRIPAGLCQYQKAGAGAGSYDITLPPSTFPPGTTSFTDPLAPFCAQIHVAYSAPGLARTAKGGGTAYAGWHPSQPFFGNVCLPEAPDPPPPGDPDITVDKTGALVGGDVQFTVTVANPTAVTAPDVTLVDTLPPDLTWTLPPGCAAGAGSLVTCDIGDLASGASVELLFVATPGTGDCGTFTNVAEGFIGADTEPTDSDSASVEVSCPPEPDDPLILITKTPTSTSVALPGPITYVMTAENVGPGAATDVQFTDELPAGATWTIGSGSNVCSITGSTLSCFAPDVPDGVFEVVEVIGSLDGSVCGVMDNSAEISWTGGSAPGGAVADADSVEITGCGGTQPTPEPNPTSSAAPGSEGNGGNDGGTGAGGDGDVPNTSIAPPRPGLGLLDAGVLLLVAAGLLLTAGRATLRARRR